ncbi:MAG TPA: VOC family protein [Polyangiaceae bacterium]|nr:VOC family protein [Polyangiaceae bacterium]
MILALDHVNLRTARLEAMRAFYVEVLGLRVGPRPAFSFGGAWLYCGDTAAVHLVEVDEAPPPGDGLRLEHFALRARGLGELLERLRARSVPARLGFVRDFGICQVNVHDPDGTHVHIDFDIAEAEALGLAPA